MSDRDMVLRAKVAALTLALAVLVPTACGGGASPSVTSGAQIAPSGSSDATTLNVSGEYAGKVNDSVFGKGVINGDPNTDRPYSSFPPASS
jgi:hypothetical protein